MKINGTISILINSDYTTIEIEDKDANTTFVKVRLTPEQLSMALSRLSYTPCEMEVHKLERVGKRHEHKSHEFEIPNDVKNNELHNLALLSCENGWTPDNYFGSQNSFFTKDGKKYARCTIRRWV